MRRARSSRRPSRSRTSSPTEEPDGLRQQVAIFPSTRGSLDDPYFTKEDGTDATRVRVASAKSLKTAVNYTPVVLSEQMKTVLRNAVAKAVQGKQSPEAALDGAVAACNRLLRSEG